MLSVENVSAVCAEWFRCLEVLFQWDGKSFLLSIMKGDVDFRKLCGYAVLR